MAIGSEIAELEALLNAGATYVFVDGQKVSYDLDAVRRRLRELRRQKEPNTRPRIATIDRSSF